MSLKPEPISPIPEQTARVARVAFPKGNTFMQMRDELGVLWEDEEFADLFPRRGQPALAPWRLALVTVMQFAENLPDRQAADAVRARIDWKYALGLELTDAGFDFSVLSEFRGRLLEGRAEQLLLEKMLERFAERGWVKGPRQAENRLHSRAVCRANAEQDRARGRDYAGSLECPCCSRSRVAARTRTRGLVLPLRTVPFTTTFQKAFPRAKNMPRLSGKTVGCCSRGSTLRGRPGSPG